MQISLIVKKAEHLRETQSGRESDCQHLLKKRAQSRPLGERWRQREGGWPKKMCVSSSGFPGSCIAPGNRYGVTGEPDRTRDDALRGRPTEEHRGDRTVYAGGGVDKMSWTANCSWHSSKHLEMPARHPLPRIASDAHARPHAHTHSVTTPHTTQAQVHVVRLCLGSIVAHSQCVDHASPRAHGHACTGSHT